MSGNSRQTSLKRRTVRGVRYTVVTTVFNMVLQAAILVVLARLLTPNDYGSMAAAMIFTSPLQTTLLSATERAIILQSDMTEEALSSALFVLLAVTGCLAALLAAGGLLIAANRGSEFGLVLALLSPTLILSGACVPARARLRYQLAFGKIGMCDLFAQLAGTGGVGIACALHGFGPFSLVLATIAQTTIQLILYWTLCGTKIRLHVNFAYIRMLAGLSYQVVRISVLDTIQGQLLFVFTWFYSGHAALGVLNRAYYIIQLPTQLLVTALTSVLFTGFTLVKNERERLVSAMRMLVEISGVVIFPITAGMAASAPELVRVVLGAKWVGAEPLIRWLAIGTACAMTGQLFAVLAEATGRLREKFLVQILATVAALTIYFLLARYGLLGSSFAFAASWLVFLIGQLALGAYILKVHVAQFARWLIPGFASSAAIVAYVLILRSAFAGTEPLLHFTLEVVGCAVILAATLRAFFPRLLADLLRFTGLGVLTNALFLTSYSGFVSRN